MHALGAIGTQVYICILAFHVAANGEGTPVSGSGAAIQGPVTNVMSCSTKPCRQLAATMAHRPQHQKKSTGKCPEATCLNAKNSGLALRNQQSQKVIQEPWGQLKLAIAE